MKAEQIIGKLGRIVLLGIYNRNIHCTALMDVGFFF